MANRYLQATGNWNGPVWAATSGGAAGSAATPTSADDVYIAANYTVTLTANATCRKIFHTNGTLSLSSYTLSLAYDLQSFGSTARTLNLNSGTLELLHGWFYLLGTNLTFNAGTSLIVFNMVNGDITNDFESGGKTFNDVIINIGQGDSYSYTLSITGSPTFRSLIIKSANSAAHTVNFENWKFIEVKKFVAIGSSSTNKLTLKATEGTELGFYEGYSSYGQYVNIQNISATLENGIENVSYIGSSSTVTGDYDTWLIQDPPKISTLVDPLTTAPGSNTNWGVSTYSGATLPSVVTNGYEGGGYRFGNKQGVFSTGVYDAVDSDFIFEVSSYLAGTDNNALTLRMGWDYGDMASSSVQKLPYIFFRVQKSGAFPTANALEFGKVAYRGSLDLGTLKASPIPGAPFYIKLRINSSDSKLYAWYSTDGTNWVASFSSARSITDDLNYYRTSRISISSVQVGTESSYTDIGSLNPNINATPTVILASPANGVSLTTTTPTLSFTGTDPEGNNVTYQLQVTEVDGVWTSQPDMYFVNALPASDTGFSGTDPYTSGTSVTYTVQTPLTTGAKDYWWRVRAKDPSGSNSWGEWTTARKMTTEAIAPTVTSGSSSAITSSAATTGGDVVSDGGASITERGVVYGTAPNPTTANSKKTTTGTTGALSVSLTGLNSNTTYYWRAYATNAKGTSYGSSQSFTTLAGAATVSLTSIYGITASAASIDAEVSQSDSATITERGVVYSTTTNPTTANSKVTTGSGTGTYTSTLSSLDASTTYYVRSYAINNGGTWYSPQGTFMTTQTPAVPTVVTGTAAIIGALSASINGSNVTLDGASAITQKGIVFSSTETVPTTADNKVVASTIGLGSFNVTLTGLSQETTYYARAYAINSTGTGYGDVMTITTTELFAADAGDGYWTWTPTNSDAIVGRSQSTLTYSSANLMLSDLDLENGETYTLYFRESTSDQGETAVKLQWFDAETKMQQVITPGTPYTFTYDTTKSLWSIRLFVTGASVEADNINATFSDMYLAKESDFSGFVPFIGKGVTEIKIENNWLIDTKRTSVIQSMFDAMKGKSWYPFNIDTEGLGWFEIGDRFTIEDDAANTQSVVLWNSKLTVDGGISENLFTKTPEKTETNYKRAGKLGGLWKRTEISVDKNTQDINSIVEDIYSFDGVINTKFSEIAQDVNEVRTTIQGTGGVNLIQNSVMYAFDTDNQPASWTVTGAGTLVIQASPESLTAGAVSGNAFTLSDKTVTQTVTVRKDVDFIPEEQKTYYAISARVKKNTVGAAYIKLINRNETLTIDLPDQTEYYWDSVKLEEILPLDDHFDIEIYSDADADLQVTDLILAPGKTKREWSQANGEVMNSSVSITKDGMTIRSPQFQNDYTTIDALGFEVHSKEVNGDRVFGFNKDETNVSKLKADKQMSMPPMRTVPINYGTYKGWAFTLSEDN